VSSRSSYNATVERLDAKTGEVLGVFVAEVDDAGKMLRSNSVQFSGLEGTPQYDAYLRRTGDQFRITKDGGAGYRQRILKLALPPAYQR
jgi:hypothetical protein